MTIAKLLALTLLGSAGMITSVAVAETVSDGGKKFTTELTGEAEVDAAGVPNQGDLSATGTAKITVNPGQGRICWDITTGNFTAGTTSIVGAHIHSAQAGQNGPIVVHLAATLNGTNTGCTTTVTPGGAELTRALIDSIRKSPQGFYVNVHTNLKPAGAIRGQLG